MIGRVAALDCDRPLHSVRMRLMQMLGITHSNTAIRVHWLVIDSGDRHCHCWHYFSSRRGSRDGRQSAVLPFSKPVTLLQQQQRVNCQATEVPDRGGNGCGERRRQVGLERQASSHHLILGIIGEIRYMHGLFSASKETHNVSCYCLPILVSSTTMLPNIDTTT